MYTHGNTVVRTLQLRRPDIMYNMIQPAQTTCDGQWDVRDQGSAGLSRAEALCHAPKCRRKVWFQSPLAAEKQLGVVSR